MPLFRGMTRKGTVIASGVLLSSLLFAACGENSPTILDPQGPVAAQESGIFWIILWVATAVFVAVEAALIYSIWRFRDRPGADAPRQIHGNNTVELIWTVAPSIVLFIVLFFTIQTMIGVTTQPAGDKLEVKAVGHQWWWEFQYPSQHLITADTLYVPQGTTIQVDLVSNNVIHSFWVPALTGKTDLIPGHNNVKWFSADKTGTYPGECAEYCGTQHAHMEFNVVVLSKDAFQTWVSSQQQAAQTPSDANAAAGAKLFAASCTSCHGIVGVNLQSFDDPKATALIGPNLTHFGGRTYIAGGVLETSNVQKYTWSTEPACQITNGQVADPNNCGIYQWLKDPQAVKPGNDMQIGQLTPQQITQLVAYLESLK